MTTQKTATETIRRHYGRDTPDLYHYTTGHKLAGILAEGGLKPSAPPPWAQLEKPILWFSSNDTYEASACKPMMLSDGRRVLSAALLHDKVGLYRLKLLSSVPAALPTQWPTCGREAGMEQEASDRLEAAGRQMGARPSEWWGSFYGCPLDSLQLFSLGAEDWVPMTIAEALAEFGAKDMTVASYSEHQGRITRLSTPPEPAGVGQGARGV